MVGVIGTCVIGMFCVIGICVYRWRVIKQRLKVQLGARTDASQVVVVIDSSASALHSPPSAPEQSRAAVKLRSAAQLLATWEIDQTDVSIGAVIGESGQASMHIGRWRGMTVAIKPIKPVRALARVRHPNVVRLLGACVDVEQPLVVLAYAPHGSLQAALDEGVIDPSNVAGVAALLGGIARGMEAIHAHSVIHLDLKPHNVLLGPDNVPWVTGFGLSTYTNQGPVPSSTAGGRGTLVYKPPEMFAEGFQVTQQADVWAFAMLAWAVVTGERPWSTLQSPETQLLAIHAKGARRPEMADGSDWRDATAPALAKLIEACWAQDGEERPAFGGGRDGIVSLLDGLAERVLQPGDVEAIEALAERVFAAECELVAAQDLGKEYDHAAEGMRPSMELGEVEEEHGDAGTSVSFSTGMARTPDQSPGVAEEAQGETPAALLSTAQGRQARELKEERAGLEITVACAARASEAARRQLRKATGGDEALEQIMRRIRSMREAGVAANATTLTSIARGGELACPRLVALLPGHAEGGLLARARRGATERCVLVFLDPVSGCAAPCGRDGRGYQLALPRQWLLDHGPRLRDGLSVAKLLLGGADCGDGRRRGGASRDDHLARPHPLAPGGSPRSELDGRPASPRGTARPGVSLADRADVHALHTGAGRLAGLPIDSRCLPLEVVSKREAEAVAGMDVLLGGDGAETGGAMDGTLSKKQAKAATGKANPARAYRALRALVAEQCGDPELRHCGLERVKARDGTVEWVSKESRATFEQDGAACLVWKDIACGTNAL